MCTGMEGMLVPALVSAAGAGVNYLSAQDRADEQRRAAMQDINAQAGIQRQANARTDQFVENTFDPTKRVANYEQAASQAQSSLGDMLTKQSASGQGDVNSATTGAVSDAYTRARADAAATQADKARTLARLLARGGARGGLSTSESLAGSQYSSDMMGYGVDSQLSRNRAAVRTGAAGNRGGDLALLGGILSGVAPFTGPGVKAGG